MHAYTWSHAYVCGRVSLWAFRACVGVAPGHGVGGRLRRWADGHMHDHGHVLLVDGVECASWGHGIKSKGIAHEFWGSERVIEALANCGTDAGRIVVRGCIRSGNGEVVEFVA